MDNTTKNNEPRTLTLRGKPQDFAMAVDAFREEVDGRYQVWEHFPVRTVGEFDIGKDGRFHYPTYEKEPRNLTRVEIRARCGGPGRLVIVARDLGHVTALRASFTGDAAWDAFDGFWAALVAFLKNAEMIDPPMPLSKLVNRLEERGIEAGTDAYKRAIVTWYINGGKDIMSQSKIALALHSDWSTIYRWIQKFSA